MVPRAVFGVTAIPIVTNFARPGARLERIAVAIERNLAEIDRPAMGVATHAIRTIVIVAAFASGIRGTGKPQRRLAPQLHLVDSDLTRSRLYHLVKWSLPDDTALLVAAVDGEPKFKGMEPGSLAWLRSQHSG